MGKIEHLPGAKNTTLTILDAKDAEIASLREAMQGATVIANAHKTIVAKAVKAERELRPILAAVNAGLSKAAIALVGKPDPSKVPDDVAKRELGGTNAKPMP